MTAHISGESVAPAVDSLATQEFATAEVPATTVFEARALALGWMLWRSRLFLAKVTVIVCALTTVIVFLIPRQYQSTTRLMPPDVQSGGVGLAALASLAGQGGGLGILAGDLLGGKSTGALFVGVLQSRSVEDYLVDRFDLRKVYGVAQKERAREILHSKTEVYEDRKSGIITIGVTDRSPKRAADMAQAYVGELDNVINHVSTSSARRERSFLEERLKAVKQDLDSAARDLSEYSSKNAITDIKDQGRAMVEAAAVLQGQLIAAQAELQGLEQIYTGNNVKVRALRARVSELQRQLNKLGGKAPGPSDDATGSQPAAAGQDMPSIRQLPLLGVRYADLYRRAKVEELVYETLTQRYELAKVQEAKEIPNVRVLDPPNLPERKIWPPRLRFMVLGALAGFLLAIGWVIASDQWQQVTPDDPKRIFLAEVARNTAGIARFRIPLVQRRDGGADTP